MTKVTRVGPDFNPTPSLERSAALTVGVAGSVPRASGAVGVPVATEGAVAGELGLDRATLVASGFDGKVGQALLVPRPDGPSLVAVGIGDAAELDASRLRNAAVGFAHSGRQALSAASRWCSPDRRGTLVRPYSPDQRHPPRRPWPGEGRL